MDPLLIRAAPDLGPNCCLLLSPLRHPVKLPSPSTIFSLNSQRSSSAHSVFGNPNFLFPSDLPIHSSLFDPAFTASSLTNSHSKGPRLPSENKKEKQTQKKEARTCERKNQTRLAPPGPIRRHTSLIRRFPERSLKHTRLYTPRPSAASFLIITTPKNPNPPPLDTVHRSCLCISTTKFPSTDTPTLLSRCSSFAARGSLVAPTSIPTVEIVRFPSA